MGVADGPRESQLPPFPLPGPARRPSRAADSSPGTLLSGERTAAGHTRASLFSWPSDRPVVFCPRPALPRVKPHPPRPRLFSRLPSPHQIQHPASSLPPFLPLFFSLSRFNIPPPPSPPLSASFILILSLRFWSSTRYSCSRLSACGWTPSRYSLFHTFPRPRNDQPSTRILPVVKPPPDTVRAYSTAHSQFVFFVAVNVLRRGSSTPLRTLC